MHQELSIYDVFICLSAEFTLREFPVHLLIRVLCRSVQRSHWDFICYSSSREYNIVGCLIPIPHPCEEIVVVPSSRVSIGTKSHNALLHKLVIVVNIGLPRT